MRTIQRLLLFTALFILSFSNIASALDFSSPDEQHTIPKPVKHIADQFISPENPDEIVRIIVELEEEPTIQKATKKGVLYKELKPTERANLEEVISLEQETIQEKIEKEAPSIEYHKNFTTVFNGFSAEVEAEYVEKIANMAGVKAVYEATEYERPIEKPEMIYSKDLVQAQQAWNEYGFKGEGMVVGVIDTGIDPSHKDMLLSNTKKAEITAEEVQALLDNDSIEAGKYYTAKVPFGYNYMDDNDIILDLAPGASMHGMHVAGTVGANGDEDNGGIKGVAPEVQLLALKVFGNDPEFQSTFGDIYIEAIDDAIKLGADVINMSLGSTAGFVNAKHPEQQAVKRAVDNGVLVAISAGNSALYGDGYFAPFAENPDYGLTGSPSVSEYSLSVASFENNTLTAYSFAYSVDGSEAGRALYLLANDSNPLEELKMDIPVMDAGFGKPADFAAKDFKGKIALISRGEIPFAEKGWNAQKSGASGVIIYNNTEGTVNMASDPAIKIPYLSILQSDGMAMKAKLDEGKTVTVAFDGKFTNTTNPSAGKMSDFTSWGPTPNLDFKPEITAPGGNIFSTLNDNQYGIMSGTSMAAPHVSGGAALVMERVDKEFKLKKSKRIQMTKNLLMNTAKPVELVPGEYVSPRRQGAGLMQLAKALNTDVIVTNEATGEAKVALKEIKGDMATFTLEAQNFSDDEKTFDVDVVVQVDETKVEDDFIVTDPNNIGSEVVTDIIDIDTVEEITIPAKGTVTFNVSIDLSSLGYLENSFINGYFVDGFVLLTDLNEETTGNVPLSIPFFGFNGEWDDAPLFDPFAWDPMSYWGYTVLVDEQGMRILGGNQFNPDRFGFSPNGDGVRDQAIPVFSLLRNAKDFKVEVTDSTGKVLRTLRTAKELRKHYTIADGTPPYSYNLNYGWDGIINNKLAEDGNYFIRLSGVIDYKGAEWQSIAFPVKVDTVAPSATATFNTVTQSVTLVNADDGEGTGVYTWEVYINGEPVSAALDPEIAHYELTDEVSLEDEITILVTDHALNSTMIEVEKTNEVENDAPIITIESPNDGDIFNNGEIIVRGSVVDESPIEMVTVNGQETAFTDSTFNHTLNLSDGENMIVVEATDLYGNTGEAIATVIVDAQAPELYIISHEEADESVKFNIHVHDNFNQITLRVNGVEYNPFDEVPEDEVGFDKEAEFEVTVSESDVYLFEVEDIAGNITAHPYVINDGEYMELIVPKLLSLLEDESTPFVVEVSKTTSDGTTMEDVTSAAEYTLDNPIVEIDKEAKMIKALNPGTATVTVSYLDLTKTFTVTVNENSEPEPEPEPEPELVQQLVLDNNHLSLFVGDRHTIKANLLTLEEGEQTDSQDVSEQLRFKDYDSTVLKFEGIEFTALGVGSTDVTVLYNEFEGKLKVDVKSKTNPKPDRPDKQPKPSKTSTSPKVPTGDQSVGEQLKDSKVKEVKLEAPAPTASQPTVKAELSSHSMQALAVSGKPLVVKAGTVEVGVPSSLIKGMNLAENEKATFQVELVKDAIVVTSGNLASDVFDFSISISGEKGTRIISNFVEPVSVKLPIKSIPADSRKLAAYFVNDETGKLEYSGGKYSDGALNFTTRHFSKFVAIEYNKTFADIHSHWAKKEIEDLASRMITSGTTEKTFMPDDEMTRAQFAVMLSRALNLPRKKFEGIFKDIPESMSWGNVDIEAAYRAGIIKGKPDEMFEPNTPITREQMALMIIRAIEFHNPEMLKELKPTNGFNDISKANPVSQKAIKDAASLGLLNGYFDGSFRLRDYSTRAQTSVVIYRLLEQLGEL